jgi:hypothetical protein
MYVVYFDEVKSTPDQSTYYVGGILVPMDQVGQFERKVADLSQELFKSIELTTDTEFHASHIHFGKGVFKGWKIENRIEALVKLVDILTEGDVIKRVYSAIDTTKLLAPEKAAEFAFAHFCERVQMCAGKNPCILIGDLDDQQSKNMVRDFSRYRAKGTPWAYGIEINSIVDSVHFCRSHHSRLIQLADVYLFTVTHGNRSGYMAKIFGEAIKEKSLYAHRYKTWPN